MERDLVVVVLQRSCCCFLQVVVADEKLHGTEVVGQFLGKRQGLAH